MLKEFVHTRMTEGHSNTVSSEDFMDDGSRIALAVTIDPETGDCTFDFTGTDPEVLVVWFYLSPHGGAIGGIGVTESVSPGVWESQCTASGYVLGCYLLPALPSRPRHSVEPRVSRTSHVHHSKGMSPAAVLADAAAAALVWLCLPMVTDTYLLAWVLCRDVC